MLIRSKIERADGTRIELYGTKYHFKQEDPKDAESPHVCEVKDKKAIRRLIMDVPEGYEPHTDKDKSEAEEIYGWSEVVEAESEDAPGQPEVVTEYIDDDEDPDAPDPDLDPDDDDLELAGEEELDDDATGDDGKESKRNLTANSSKAEWLEYAAAELDITIDAVKDEKAFKDAVEAYASENYGVDLDKRSGVVKMLKAVYDLESKADR